MSRTFAARTHVGQARRVNQDRVEADPDGRYFMVADGMGGHAGGEQASSLATTVAREYLEAHFEEEWDTKTFLQNAMKAVNRRLREDQRAHPERSNMGTTLTVVIRRENQWWYAHVGDSRAYRWRDGHIEQLTPDHTWIADQMRAGTIAEDTNLKQWLGHVLSQHMGQETLERIEIAPISVQEEDRLLLCSDGLTAELSDEEIATYLTRKYTCEEAVNALISAANANSGSDNIAIIVIDNH